MEPFESALRRAAVSTDDAPAPTFAAVLRASLLAEHRGASGPASTLTSDVADTMGRMSAGSGEFESGRDDSELSDGNGVDSTARRHRVLLAIACAAVLALTVVSLTVRRTNTASPVDSMPVDPTMAQPEVGADGPPGVDHTQPWLWLDTPQLPLTGGHISGVVVNPTDDELDVSPGSEHATFERWNGDGWTKLGDWYGDDPMYTGDLVFVMPLIILQAHSIKRDSESALIPSGLDPGWYRLTKFGASGVFELTDAAQLSEFASELAWDGAVVEPALASSGSPMRLSKDTSTMAGASTEDLTDFLDSIGPEVQLQRRHGTEWVPMGTLPLVWSSSADAEFTLPDQLVDGVFRAIVTADPVTPDAVTASAEFWVANDPEIPRVLDPTRSRLERLLLPDGWKQVQPRWGNGFAAGRLLSAGGFGTVTISQGPPSAENESLIGAETIRTVDLGDTTAAFMRSRNTGDPTGTVLVLNAFTPGDEEYGLIAERGGDVSDDEIIQVLTALTPIIRTESGTRGPVPPARPTGTVAELLGREGAVTVRGWVVISDVGEIRLCSSIDTSHATRCGEPSIMVEPSDGDPSVPTWERPAMHTDGDVEISDSEVEISGSLKGDIVYPNVL